jgi:hypothetical protein
MRPIYQMGEAKRKVARARRLDGLKSETAGRAERERRFPDQT